MRPAISLIGVSIGSSPEASSTVSYAMPVTAPVAARACGHLGVGGQVEEREEGLAWAAGGRPRCI